MTGTSPLKVKANSGLSGRSWLIGASAQNNYASIVTRRSQIWKTPQLIPDFLDFGFSYANMASDYARKNGKFPDLVSLVDLWSWFIGYGLISCGQSPSKTLFRDIATESNYQSGVWRHAVLNCRCESTSDRGFIQRTRSSCSYSRGYSP
jgi:hypothetical protein